MHELYPWAHQPSDTPVQGVARARLSAQSARRLLHSLILLLANCGDNPAGPGAKPGVRAVAGAGITDTVRRRAIAGAGGRGERSERRRSSVVSSCGSSHN